MAEDPDIFAYRDFRTFVRDWLAVRPRSLAFLERRCDLSKPHLSNVLSGARRLTPNAAETLCDGLRLGIHERRYFLALVGAEEGETERRRERGRLEIQGMSRFRKATRIQRDTVAIASAWYLTVVLELAQRPGFRADASWIATQIRPPITEDQAQEALDILTRTQRLPRDDEDPNSPNEQVVTDHQVLDPQIAAAVRSTMRQWLRRADEALDLPHDQRQFGSMTVAIAAGQLDEFRAKINNFQQDILGMENAERADGDTIYHLGIQFFPVTTTDQSTDT